MADHAGRGLLAHEQRERVDEDGFARAGFSRQEIEAGTKAGDGVIDDGVVLGSEFEQHGNTGYRLQQGSVAGAGLRMTCCCFRVSNGLMLVMREPIRVGVVGFGLAGRFFHAAVVSATPGLELACVVERSGDESARVHPRVKVARSVEELLADVGIQLVVIATPSYSHFELAQQCLREQRHVVVDKPFALKSEEAAELIRMARERRLVLAPFQNRRWDGDYQTVRQVIASGELGRLVTYESHFDRFRPQPRPEVWRESGGPGSGILFDLGPHLIDQALGLFGPPTNLYADVRIDRENGAADDAFDLRLEYMAVRRLTVLLRSTLTACIAGPRFLLPWNARQLCEMGPGSTGGSARERG